MEKKDAQNSRVAVLKKSPISWKRCSSKKNPSGLFAQIFAYNYLSIPICT